MTNDRTQADLGPLFFGGRIVRADELLAPPRRFVLRRRVDVSGVSGTGDVADGVLWADGTASIRWRGEHPSVVFWDRGRVSVEAIHGHQGATEIVWLDQDDEQPADPVLEEAIARALSGADTYRQLEEGDAERFAEAVAAALPGFADRSAVLRAAADVLDTLPEDATVFDAAEHRYKGGAAAERLRSMAAEAESADRPAPSFAGRPGNGQSARADLLNAFASWGFTTRYGSREAADHILSKHRSEALAEAADWFERDCPDSGGPMNLCMCHASEPLRAWADEAQQHEPEPRRIPIPGIPECAAGCPCRRDTVEGQQP
ncbi:hypothetical protein [Streptomyces sp. NPDC050145]|uniref:hypothetical protein n=1 Tax=Streptomyces sp. NPDC050145 TaxID=3365602 RepID=UPI0037B7B82E